MKKFVVSQKISHAYKTLEEALAAAKNEEHTLLENEPVNIIIDGVLTLTKPIFITAEDLPVNHTVNVVGKDDKSGFSGGVIVSGFTKWKDNIWRVKLPNVSYTRHLYIDGKSAKRPALFFGNSKQAGAFENNEFSFASLPGEEVKTLRFNGNYPGGEIPDGVEAVYPMREFKVENYSGIATTHTEIANWRNARDLEMVFEASWTHRVIPIEKTQFLEDGRLYIKPLEHVFLSARALEGARIGAAPNYIENVFELLGNPFEWYFDRNEQTLYVGFEDGDCPENHEIVVPIIEQLLHVKGELSEKPSNLCFENLKFTHTTWLFPQKYGVPEVQANQMKFLKIPDELVLEKPYEGDYQKVISALRIIAARNVSFENCNFTCLGTGALQYEYGAEECYVKNNNFYEIGGSAVCLGDFYLERAHHPSDQREIVGKIQISDNNIHHTGVDFRGAPAIAAGYVQDVDITNNDINFVPYSAISLGWGWGWADVSDVHPRITPWTTPSVCMRNNVSYNHIHHCMMQLHDGGAIYTLGRMSGTVIKGNYIHESSGYNGLGYDGGNFGGALIHGFETEEIRDPEGDVFFNRHGVPGGIYLDEGSAEIKVCENVFHDVAIPLFYHNQMKLGYETISFADNVINKRPGDADFPTELVKRAGRK